MRPQVEHKTQAGILHSNQFILTHIQRFVNLNESPRRSLGLRGGLRERGLQERPTQQDGVVEAMLGQQDGLAAGLIGDGDGAGVRWREPRAWSRSVES
jgi:hypothetical protein